jgi:hypothetical protein
MRCYADLAAIFEYRASRAVGQRARADVFAEWDEQSVDFDPIALWQDLFQFGHGLFGCACVDVAPSVGDAVHVNIYRDSRLAAGYSEREVCAFRANAAEGCQDVEVAWEIAVELFNNTLRYRFDLMSFLLVIGRCAD